MFTRPNPSQQRDSLCPFDRDRGIDFQRVFWFSLVFCGVARNYGTCSNEGSLHVQASYLQSQENLKLDLCPHACFHAAIIFRVDICERNLTF